MREVLWTSLQLGSTSFGGPIAHLGYFERVYVRERRWLDETEYVGLVALCQLLPGPTSSQVNFLVGLRRAGWAGALAAWMGFTLPSALLMYAFAVFAPRVTGSTAQAVVHGLMLTAVAVVAQAVSSMWRRLCGGFARAAIACGAAVLLIFRSSATLQVAAMLLGGLGGWLWCRDLPRLQASPSLRVPQRTGAIALGLFCALLLALSLASAERGPLTLAGIFYRAGALVFGGGHVVLPLLREALVPTGWISDEAFLSGYGLAQAMPGPLFSVSAYLGAATAPAHATASWAAVALVAMFAPGLLLAVAGQYLWTLFSRVHGGYAILAGINAAVVGILAAALYDPIWTSGVQGPFDILVASAALFLLLRWNVPAILVVSWCVVASVTAAIFFP